MPSRRHAIWIAGVVVAATLAVWLVERRLHDPSGRTFRIGFEQSMPDQGVGPNGEPIGPAVDILTDQIMARTREEVLQMNRLLMSKKDSELLGPSEYEIRDRVHNLGAKVIEAALNERKKGGTKGRA